MTNSKRNGNLGNNIKYEYLMGKRRAGSSEEETCKVTRVQLEATRVYLCLLNPWAGSGCISEAAPLIPSHKGGLGHVVMRQCLTRPAEL